MTIAFFAARSVHRTYFSRVSQHLNRQRANFSTVIWHKWLWLNPLWLLSLPQAINTQVADLVQDYIKEKQNSRKHRSRSDTYWSIFRALKSLEALILIAVYHRAIKASGVSQVVVWNGLKFRQRIVIRAAEQLSVKPIYMENGLLPGMTTLDSKGINYFNSVPRDTEFFKQFSQGKPAFPVPSRSSKPSSLPEHFIFVPFQVNTDSQIVLFSSWLKDMRALVEALTLAENRLGQSMPTILLKPHPACDENYADIKQALTQSESRIHFVEGIETQSLIEHADAVITINSTVGLESILANQKTVVLGQAFYNLQGLTLSAPSQPALENTLQSISSFEPNGEIRSGLLHYLQSEYQVTGKWQDGSDEHIHDVSARLIKMVSA